MLTQRTIAVGEDDFTLLQFPTTKALKYGISIGKIAGAMLAGGLDADLAGEAEDDLLAGLDAGKMVEGLLSQIDEERTPKLIKAMLRDALAAYTVKGVTGPRVVHVLTEKAKGARTTRGKSSASDNGDAPPIKAPAEGQESTDSFFG